MDTDTSSEHEPAGHRAGSQVPRRRGLGRRLAPPRSPEGRDPGLWWLGRCQGTLNAPAERKDTTPVGTDQEKGTSRHRRLPYAAHRQGGRRVDRRGTGLWGEGLELDSLEAAELSALLEDEFGTDPFSEGGDLPETVGDILAFYVTVALRVILLLEAAARVAPERTAVLTPAGSATYGELVGDAGASRRSCDAATSRGSPSWSPTRDGSSACWRARRSPAPNRASTSPTRTPTSSPTTPARWTTSTWSRIETISTAPSRSCGPRSSWPGGRSTRRFKSTTVGSSRC